MRFGSICCGADWRLEERIRAAVSGERRVSRAYRWSWGEEGESSLCLVTDRRSARGLAARFRRWNAARPNPALTSVEVVGR